MSPRRSNMRPRKDSYNKSSHQHLADRTKIINNLSELSGNLQQG
jgi:hypothetical protein